VRQWLTQRRIARSIITFLFLGLLEFGVTAPAATAAILSAPTITSITAGNASLTVNMVTAGSTGNFWTYEVIRRVTTGCVNPAGDGVDVNTASLSSSFTITGLTNGCSYLVRVAANLNGVGNFAEAEAMPNDYGNWLNLTWANDGGTGVTGINRTPITSGCKSETTTSFNYSIGTNVSPGGSCNGTYFTGYFSGYVKGPITGAVTFTLANTDDAGVFAIQGNTVVTQAGGGSTSGVVNMILNQVYRVEFWYHNDGGPGASNVTWSYSGVSATSIPSSSLANDPSVLESSGGCTLGMAARCAAGSALEIKQSTGTSVDGQYWINIGGTPTLVYCIMNSAQGGGGWMLAMRGKNSDSTFKYQSSLWVNSSLTGVSSYPERWSSTDTYRNSDAKYAPFTSLKNNQMMALFPAHNNEGGRYSATNSSALTSIQYGFSWSETYTTTGSSIKPWTSNSNGFGGNSYNIAQPNGPSEKTNDPTATASCITNPDSLTNLFLNANRCAFRVVGNTWALDSASPYPYSAIGNGLFYTQTQIGFFGINYGASNTGSQRYRARIGFGWNENGVGDESSNDGTGGIGLDNANVTTMAAGSHSQCCATQTGAQVQMAFELYVRNTQAAALTGPTSVRITAGRTQSTTVAQNYSQAVTSGSATYRLSPQRPGFAIDPATGTLRVSGGLAAGTYTQNVSATDGNGASSALAVTITVVADSSETDTALSFNGSGNRLTTTATYANSGDFTMEAWVRPNGTCTSGGDQIITNYGNSWLLCKSGFFYTTFANATGGGWTYLKIGRPVRSNEWIHLAVVRSSNTVSVFLNNTTAQLTIDDSSFFSSYTLGFLASGGQVQNIGSAGTTNSHFNGLIDEVKIFNTARSISQIWSGAHTLENLSNSNLISYYDFNEGSGSSAINRAQNAAANSDFNVSGPSWTPVATSTPSGAYTYVTIPRTLINSAGGWKVPSTVTAASVLVVGGGGGGSGKWSNNSADAAGGGGGGVYEIGRFPFTPNSIEYIRVGTGGMGGVNGTERNTQTLGWRGESTTVGALSAGGGGGAGYTESGNLQQAGGAGTAGGGGGGANSFWYAYNSGSSGSWTGASGGAGSNVTIGGVLYAGRNGGLGAAYEASWSNNSGAGGGAGGNATPNASGQNVTELPGAGITSSLSGSPVEYGRGGTSLAVASPGFVVDPIAPGNGGDGYRSTNSTGYGASGANGIVLIRYITALKPTYTKPANAYLNVGMTETFTTNVASDSATVDLTRTFRWESSTTGANGTFSLIKQGTGAANAAFSWVPPDTRTTGSNFVYRLIVTDSDTAGLFITDSSTAFAVINGALNLISKSTLTKTVGVSKTETFTVSAGTPTYRYSLTPTSPYFWLDTSTVGSPRIRFADTVTVGTYYETFTVIDSVSASIAVPLTIVVNTPPSFSASSAFVDSSTVLFLDAGNTASYSGSGSTWNDISGRGLVASLPPLSMPAQNLSSGLSCDTPSISYTGTANLVFNGTSKNCGYVPNIGVLSRYTYEVWFKRTGADNLMSDYSSIIASPWSGDGKQINITLHWRLNGNLVAGIWNGASWIETTQVYVAADSWNYVAVTFDGSNLLLSLNGVIATKYSASGSVTWDATKNDQGLLIGKRFDQNGYFFSGSIGSIRIYDRVLTDSEIQQNYNATKNRFIGTLNSNAVKQKYVSRFVDTYTVTSGSESITATFTNNALAGVKWDTTTARSLVLTLQDSLTPGTYYDTITATDIYGSSSRLPITFTIAKADTLTVSMDTATVVSYNGSPITAYPRATIKGLKGSDTATSVTRFSSSLYSESTAVPTNADTYTVRGATPTFTVGSLTYYEGVIYETTTATVNKINQRALNIYMYGGIVGSPYQIYLAGGSGTGTVTETLTGVSSLSGCAISNHFLTASEQKQGFCEVRVVKAGDQNYFAETQTVQLYFMAYINNQPTGLVGSGSGIGLNGVTSVETSTVLPPSITLLSTLTLSLSSGGNFTITGTGFTGSISVKFWRNKVVDATSGNGTSIVIPVSSIASAGATSGRISVITAAGQAISVDSLTITP